MYNYDVLYPRYWNFTSISKRIKASWQTLISFQSNFWIRAWKFYVRMKYVIYSSVLCDSTGPILGWTSKFFWWKHSRDLFSYPELSYFMVRFQKINMRIYLYTWHILYTYVYIIRNFSEYVFICLSVFVCVCM